jgi:membrane protein required for beta-lactamase induction
METETKPLGWGRIIITLVVVALATGLLMGLLGTLFRLPAGLAGGGMAGGVGVVAAQLIARRRAEMAQQRNQQTAPP